MLLCLQWCSDSWPATLPHASINVVPNVNMFAFQRCVVQNRSASSRTINIASLDVVRLAFHPAPAVQAAAAFLILSTWFPWLIQGQHQLQLLRHLHQRLNLRNSLASVTQHKTTTRKLRVLSSECVTREARPVCRPSLLHASVHT